MNLAGQYLDLFDDEIGLEVGFVIVVGELAADLIFSLGRYQQDGTLHRR